MHKIFLNTKFIDHRGSIYTLYDSKNLDIKFVQDKVTTSYKGTIRGFHGDEKTWKLITCLYGSFKLIIYDINKNIKDEFILNDQDQEVKSILVPPNFLNAHQCLTDTCIMHYKWSEFYTSPDDQWTVWYEDHDIGASWFDIPVILSDRDKNAKSLKELKQWINKN